MEAGLVVLLILFGVLIIGAVAEEILRYRRKRAWYRPCPRCGLDVQKGTLDCPHCGFDFNTVGSQLK